MDLASEENKTRAERCELPGAAVKLTVEGDKQKKIGEGTFANVYKGRSVFLVRVYAEVLILSGVEKATGRKGMSEGRAMIRVGIDDAQSLSRRSRSGK